MPQATPSLIAQGTLAPIVVDLVVPCPPDRAFDYFTRDIGRWWPLARTRSAGRTPPACASSRAKAAG